MNTGNAADHGNASNDRIGLDNGNGFPRQVRLTEAALFGRVFKKPFRVKGRYFLVLAISTEELAPRLGLAIAKKKIRKAVGRNRIKRLIRESFRVTKRTLPSVDLVVMANPGANKASNQTLFAELDSHWAAITEKFTVKQDDQERHSDN